MNPWFAKAVILLASVMMVVIRAPHDYGVFGYGERIAEKQHAKMEAPYYRALIVVLALSDE